MFMKFSTMINHKPIVTSHIGFLCAIIFTSICLQAQCSDLVKCMEKEKQALLTFKQGIIDESNTLSSWQTKHECCKWKGVACNNKTGHVIKLDLHFKDQAQHPLKGEINPSLLQLQYLEYLDLSDNIFSGRVPEFIGSFTQLRVLKLVGVGWEGPIPHQLGNLSNLHTLNLSWNLGMSTHNLSWLSGLSSLTYLDLSLLNLSKAVDWLESVNRLPSLVELHLQDCGLPDVNPKSLSYVNFSTSLKVIDLSSNYNISSSIFTWVGNVGGGSLINLQLHGNSLKGPIPNVFASMFSLEILDLSDNELEGPIPDSFQNLCQLRELYLFSNNLLYQLQDLVDKLSCAKDTIESLELSNNSFTGPFPDIARFTSLKSFYASSNKLNGTLPKSLGTLPYLTSFSVSFNNLSGPLPDFSGAPSLELLGFSHNKINGILPESLRNLSSLKVLGISSNSLNGTVNAYQMSNLHDLRIMDVSGNSLTFNLSMNWIPPFQLKYLKMSSCKVGANLPQWLQTQKNLSFLDMSNVGISEEIPNWFWNLTKLQHLNLSNNHIPGTLPNLSSKAYDLPLFDLSSNELSGQVPPFPPNTNLLILSRNKLSGSVLSLCSSTLSHHLAYLDLSHNQLSGTLPNCWMQATGLLILNLANNNFSGELPNSFGALPQVLSLHLSNNNFLGGLISLKNCTELRLLDLGNNNFSAEMPNWLGDTLTKLVVLRVRTSELHGSIPLSLCHLSALQVLDVSGNKISGALPYCFNNLTALSHNEVSTGLFYSSVNYGLLEQSIIDFVTLITKGLEMEYGKNLKFMRIIDVSSNNLSGEFPNITSLVGLVSLNLSRNNLVGKVPDYIGQLEMLESLDLSRNHLVGEIPRSLSGISFLSHLNLSFNNLSGRIPLGTQLQSFDASAYIGNKGLCGPPLTEYCPGDKGSSSNPALYSDNQKNDAEGDESGFISLGFYVSLSIGFITGFWGVCLSLIFNASWRHAYFRFLCEVKDCVYVKAALFGKRIRQRLTS